MAGCLRSAIFLVLHGELLRIPILKGRNRSTIQNRGAILSEGLLNQRSKGNSPDQAPKKVLVIGGGIAGLTAAWELARLDLDVKLIEKSSFLGGHAIQFCCKAADECQKCGACLVEKRLLEVIEEPRIKVYLKSEIEKMNRNSRFSYTLSQRSLYIDSQRCTNCGLCFEKCPADGAVIRGYSKNNVPLYAIDETHCLHFKDGSCRLCEDLCPEKAINLDPEPDRVSGEADAIVVASGFQTFDPVNRPRYGYGINKNLITALDLERMLREKGEVLRPSDDKVPERIAFIQCVGSRDHKLQHGFCSQVCCGYAMRMAEAIHYRHPGAEVTIFYMDIQNCGKNFSKFYERCKDHIRFVRFMPGDIFQGEQDQLILCYGDEKDGHSVREPFDLVVLSVGIMPGPSNASLADMLKLDLDEHGFFAFADPLDSTSTSQQGVFLAGTAQGPKDIADTMAQAGQAAQRVAHYLGVMPCPK
ncbi:MAG: FAD-dependent oxidoreductase [Deltaproteobacteria bacterium]|nr:FAD-dependent oxidoreductase [Deltaproteobacteria bacterium]MBW2073405.1 FAD-dependent oxidoreductase [Deltaproteobacteria bacterium]